MSIFLLGFLLGMQHALEADHLAAVTALVAGSRSTRSAAIHGACWGLGHTLTLMAFGGAFVLLDGLVPERTAVWLEIGVGIMLAVLGLNILWKVRKKRIHVHRHHHDGIEHIHAHAHESASSPRASHAKAPHGHSHARMSSRALLVGLMHGLAGSAALLLLVLNTVDSPLRGLMYIGFFGMGSLMGMALLSVIVSVPLRWTSGQFEFGHSLVQGTLGVITLTLGGWIIAEGMLSGINPP